MKIKILKGVLAGKVFDGYLSSTDKTVAFVKVNEAKNAHLTLFDKEWEVIEFQSLTVDFKEHMQKQLDSLIKSAYVNGYKICLKESNEIDDHRDGLIRDISSDCKLVILEKNA